MAVGRDVYGHRVSVSLEPGENGAAAPPCSLRPALCYSWTPVVLGPLSAETYVFHLHDYVISGLEVFYRVFWSLIGGYMAALSVLSFSLCIAHSSVYIQSEGHVSNISGTLLRCSYLGYCPSNVAAVTWFPLVSGFCCSDRIGKLPALLYSKENRYPQSLL